jgi:hypothetical protein
MKHTIACSSGYLLHLTEEQMIRYKAAERALMIQFYLEERAANGIWASNQGKYVKNRKQLQRFDGRFMEDLVKDFV